MTLRTISDRTKAKKQREIDEIAIIRTIITKCVSKMVKSLVSQAAKDGKWECRLATFVHYEYTGDSKDKSPLFTEETFNITSVISVSFGVQTLQVVLQEFIDNLTSQDLITGLKYSIRDDEKNTNVVASWYIEEKEE